MIINGTCRLKPSHELKQRQLFKRGLKLNEQKKLCYQSEIEKDKFKSRLSNKTQDSSTESARSFPDQDLKVDWDNKMCSSSSSEETQISFKGHFKGSIHRGW